MRLLLAALIAGVAVSAPAAADQTVRGLIVENGAIRFNGVTIEPDTRREKPLMNGGHPLDERSSSAMIYVPPENRTVILDMTQRYERPVIPTPRPPPPCTPSSCGE